MKRLYYIFGLSALLLSSCNYFEYDNYEAPNSGLEGTVVDRNCLLYTSPSPRDTR